jgi:hypothetical protein
MWQEEYVWPHVLAMEGCKRFGACFIFEVVWGALLKGGPLYFDHGQAAARIRPDLTYFLAPAGPCGATLAMTRIRP